MLCTKTSSLLVVCTVSVIPVTCASFFLASERVSTVGIEVSEEELVLLLLLRLEDEEELLAELEEELEEENEEELLLLEEELEELEEGDGCR